MQFLKHAEGGIITIAILILVVTAGTIQIAYALTQITGATDGNGNIITNNGQTNSPTIRFNFSVPQGNPNLIAGFECSLDGATFAPCSSPFNVPQLAYGQHNFEVKAFNHNGKRDPTVGHFTWTITAPNIPDTIHPPPPPPPPSSTCPANYELVRGFCVNPDSDGIQCEDGSSLIILMEEIATNSPPLCRTYPAGYGEHYEPGRQDTVADNPEIDGGGPEIVIDASPELAPFGDEGLVP